MIQIESILYIDYQIIDPITIEEIKNQIILLYWVDNEKLYNKKT